MLKIINNKHKYVNSTENVIIAYSLIKFTDMSRFTLCVVTCIYISKMDVFDSLTRDGTDRLSRNVGMKLPLLAA